MSQDTLSRMIFQSFKSKGLSITSKATQALIRVLQLEDSRKHPEIVSSIIAELFDRIEKREVNTVVIDVDVVEAVVVDLSSSEDDLKEESIQLYDAFHSPKLTFDEKQKTYKVIANPTYALFGDAASRASMYRERLQLTLQRLLRSGLFSIRGLDRNNPSSEQHEISMIESLLGSTGSRLLFGMITQPEEGNWYLEDLSSTIPLNLSNSTFSEGLLTEGSLVIVLGEYEAGTFHVQNIGFPPAEERTKTLSSIGIADIFGNGYRPQQLQHYAELESEAMDAMIIVVSDIQIEKTSVFEKLKQLFLGFEDTGISPLFVLMGNFVTKSALVSNGREAVEAAFKLLADAISSAPRISQEAKFVIIPGNRDPGLNTVLPRRAIPDLFTAELRKRVAHINFTSNPSRIRFFTQEIVFFREDLLRKLQRHTVTRERIAKTSQPQTSNLKDVTNSLNQESDQTSPTAADVTEQLVLSILDQAHLWPMPAHVKPIFWDLDYTLRLCPLPHLLVLGDQVDQFSYDYCGCKVVNPGSFSSDYSFIVYRPATKSVEFSRIPA